jgi:hypothetical protein
MKKAIATSVVLLAAVLILRSSSIFYGSLIQVNNTTSNLTSQTVGSFAIPPGTWNLTHGGLNTGTNALASNLQISIDNTNFITVATLYPTATNAGTYALQPTYGLQPLYFRVQFVTTSNVYAGGTYSY